MADVQQYMVCLPAEFAVLQQVRDLVTHAGAVAGLNEKECHDLMLAVDEAATNIIEHATKITACDITCRSVADQTHHTLTVELEYNASELFAAEPPTAIEIESRLRSFQRGGLGIFLMHRLVDSIDYLHNNGLNTIRLLKRHQEVRG